MNPYTYNVQEDVWSRHLPMRDQPQTNAECPQ
jgi:hypothetical protein